MYKDKLKKLFRKNNKINLFAESVMTLRFKLKKCKEMIGLNIEKRYSNDLIERHNESSSFFR